MKLCVVCGREIPRGVLGWFCSERCDTAELHSRLAQRVVDGLRKIVAVVR